MSKIRIEKVSIVNAGTECIVNAANAQLMGGSGVCGAVFKAAGWNQLQNACNAIGHCPTGSAVITPAFNLKAKYIIHAVGPIWNGGNNKEPQKLYGAYKASLQLAKDNNCHSIAFPLISAGIYGYPKNQAWRKALQACNDFINKNPSYDIDILFAVLNDQILQMGLDELKNQTKRVDAESTSKGKKDNSRSISKVNEEETLLEELNGKALHDAIEAVRIVDKIQWGGGEIMDNGARQWPYPIYPDGIFKSFSILESDKNYVENYEQCKTVLPSEMNVQQIRTMLTYMSRGERFCDGFISRYLGNKTLLKLLLRLDDLLIRYYEKHDLDVDKRYDEPIIQSKMD